MDSQKAHSQDLPEVYRGRRFWFLVPILIYAAIMLANSSFLRADREGFGEVLIFWYSSIFLVISMVAYCGVYYKRVWPVVMWFVTILCQGVIILWNYYEEVSLALLQPERYWPILSTAHICASIACTLLYVGFLFAIGKYVLKPGWKAMKYRRNQQKMDDVIDSSISDQ